MARPIPKRKARGAKRRQAKAGYYKTQLWAALALFERLRIDDRVFDPCCGSGTIIEAARMLGIEANGSDIENRGFSGCWIFDFLTSAKAVERVKGATIVGNPPYHLAVDFVRRAMEVLPLGGRAAFLVPLAFIESEVRAPLFKEFPPRAIYPFGNRTSMPPGSLLKHRKVKAQGGSVAFAWYVWEKGYRGNPMMILPALFRKEPEEYVRAP
jgi:hypothetical protein